MSRWSSSVAGKQHKQHRDTFEHAGMLVQFAYYHLCSSVYIRSYSTGFYHKYVTWEYLVSCYDVAIVKSLGNYTR